MHIAIHYVGNATIQLATTDLPDPEFPHKRRIQYSITLPNVPGSENSFESGRVEVGNDLSILPGIDDDETLTEAYSSLLSFLGAAAESRENGENADIFPADVTEWARQYSDEIAITACELDESREAIDA